jgi:hypothetical protein
MIGILFQLLVGVQLQWDPSPDTRVVGYKIYGIVEPGNTYELLATVGKVTTVTLPTRPFQVTTYMATCFTADPLESDPSNTVQYNAPPSALSLSKSGTLTAEVFKGGQFTIQDSQNLVAWNTWNNFIAPTNTIQFQVPMTQQMDFFRLKKGPPPVEAVTKVAKAPPTPPLPPQLHLTFRQKLRLFFRYRPGHHVDPRKGAERLR